MYDEMDMHSYDTSNHVVCISCVSWVGGLDKKHLLRKLTKVKRLSCLITSSAFPGTPTSYGALKILLDITLIKEFLLAEAVRESYRIAVSGLWHAKTFGSFGKTKIHVDVCNAGGRCLPLLQTPADRIKKTKVLYLTEISNAKLRIKIMDKKTITIRSISVLNHSTIRVYTDVSKVDGRVGTGFYGEFPNNSPKQAFFHLRLHSTVF